RYTEFGLGSGVDPFGTVEQEVPFGRRSGDPVYIIEISVNLI
ncbi:24362_t:CDS:1, partial [Dentiscutata erythropus]